MNKTESDNKIVLINNDKSYSLGELKELVFIQVIYLKKIACKNVVLSECDNFEFIINFLASIYAGKELFLLSDCHKLNELNIDYYLPELQNDEINQNEICFENIEPQDIIINFLTSGSSSTPKLIKKTLFNLIEEAKDLNDMFLKSEQNLRFISTTKLTHLFGLSFHLMVPLCGGFVIDTATIDYPEQINFENALLVATPSFLEKISKYNFELPISPKWIFSSGAKLKDDVFSYFETKSNVIEIYGSTESGVVAYRNSSSSEALTKAPNVLVKQDEKNQIVLQSNYFPEYEITLNDVIEMKSDEEFVMLNRSDRILKIQEKRISASNLEEKLNTNDFIENSHCLKINDKIACVVVLTRVGKEYFLENGNIELIKSIKSYLKNKTEIIPQKWRFLHEIPKNKMGKLDTQKIEQIFMTNLSHPFVLNQHSDKNKAEIELFFDKNSNFFKGHFDNYPIVPGVVQLFFVDWFIKDVFGISLLPVQMKKIKFSNLIRPNQIIKLLLVNEERFISYKYFNNDTTFSSGIFPKSDILEV